MLNKALLNDLLDTNALIKARTGIDQIEFHSPRAYVQFVANEIGINDLVEVGDMLQVSVDEKRFELHAF